MTATNSKLLPSKLYWAIFIFLSILAFLSTITVDYGWVLIAFPLLAYAFGRGRQKEMEGLKKH